MIEEKIKQYFFDLSLGDNERRANSFGSILSPERPKFIKATHSSQGNLTPEEKILESIFGTNNKREKSIKIEDRFPKWSFHPQGLYSEIIFGPKKDFECACGTFKGKKHKGTVCYRCGVEVLSSEVRNERFGHIELPYYFTNIEYVYGPINITSFLLGVYYTDLEKVIYENAYICVEPGPFNIVSRNIVISASSDDSLNKIKKIIDLLPISNEDPLYDEYVGWRYTFDLYSSGNMLTEEIIVDVLSFFKKVGILFERGIAGLQSALNQLDFEKEKAVLQKRINEETAINGQSQILPILEARSALFNYFIDNDLKTDSLFSQVLPVIPAGHRLFKPIRSSGSFLYDDLNYLYERVIERSCKIRRLIEMNSPAVILQNEKRMLQEAIDDLIDNGKRRRPIKNDNGKKYRSILDKLNLTQDELNKEFFGECILNQLKAINENLIKAVLNNQKVLCVDGIYYSDNYEQLICCDSSKEGKAEIASGVKTVYEKAFYNCKLLTEILLPDSIVAIEDEAFSGCEQISSIRLPSKIIRINDFLFEKCLNLERIYMPSSIKSFGGPKYSEYSDHILIGYCPKLSEVIVDKANKVFESVDGMLLSKDGKELLFCPYGKAGALTIPDTVETICPNSINSCGELTEINVSKNVKSIKNIFYGCGKIESINVDQDNEFYSSVDGCLLNKDKTIFLRCPEGKKVFKLLPDNVSIISKYSFTRCKHLKSIVVPNTVKEIGKEAFSECETLTSISLPFVGKNGIDYNTRRIEKDEQHLYLLSYIFKEVPDSLEKLTVTGPYKIFGRALSDCNKLKRICFKDEFILENDPYHLGITGSLFLPCTSLENIEFSGNEESPFFSKEGILYGRDFYRNECTLVKYPPGLTEVKFTVPDFVCGIGPSAFVVCNNLKEIHVPGGVKRIGEDAFFGCKNLENISLEGGPKEIGDNAFSRCASLEEVIIPEGTEKMGHQVFSLMEKLQSLTIPKTVREIGAHLCADSPSLRIINYFGSINDWQNISKNGLYETDWLMNSYIEEINCSDGILKV